MFWIFRNKINKASESEIHPVDDIIIKFEKYIDNMPIIENKNQFIKFWDERNDLYNNHKLNIHYDYSIGPKQDLMNFIEREVRKFHLFYEKKDPECFGWQEFTKMVKGQKNKCSYKWGINLFGIEVYRFGQNRYAYVKIFGDRYFA